MSHIDDFTSEKIDVDAAVNALRDEEDLRRAERIARSFNDADFRMQRWARMPADLRERYTKRWARRIAGIREAGFELVEGDDGR